MIQTTSTAGGRSFMASMGISLSMGDTPFRAKRASSGRSKQNTDPPLQCSDCDEILAVPAILGAHRVCRQRHECDVDYRQLSVIDFDEFSLGPVFPTHSRRRPTPLAITFESVSGKPCGMSSPEHRRGQFQAASFSSRSVRPPSQTTAWHPTTQLLVAERVNLPCARANGQGVVFLDTRFTTTNDVLLMEVGDSIWPGTGQAQSVFVTSSRTNRTTVTLLETDASGIVQGALKPSWAETRTQPTAGRPTGDTITATYFDESNNRNVTATAIIDTRPASHFAVGRPPIITTRT